MQFRADFDEMLALYSGASMPAAPVTLPAAEAIQTLEAGEPEIPDDLVRGRTVEVEATVEEEEEERRDDVNGFFG